MVTGTASKDSVTAFLDTRVGTALRVSDTSLIGSLFPWIH